MNDLRIVLSAYMEVVTMVLEQMEVTLIYVLSIRPSKRMKYLELQMKCRLHARIPVIRFEDPITHIQCDLCFNNILPIRNTFLLKTYSFVDKRVRVLGIIIKKW